MSGPSPWLPSTPSRVELSDSAAASSTSAPSSHRVFGQNVTNSASRPQQQQQHLTKLPGGACLPAARMTTVSKDSAPQDQPPEPIKSSTAIQTPPASRGASPACATPQGRDCRTHHHRDRSSSSAASKRSRSGDVLPLLMGARRDGVAAVSTSATEPNVMHSNGGCADCDSKYDEPEFATDPEVRFGSQPPPHPTTAAVDRPLSPSLLTTGERMLLGLQQLNRDNITWTAELQGVLSVDTVVAMPPLDSFALDEVAMSALLDGFAEPPQTAEVE